MIIQRANMTSTLSAIGETVKIIADCLPKDYGEILDCGCGEGIYGMVLKSIFRNKIMIEGIDQEEGQFVSSIYDRFYKSSLIGWDYDYGYDVVLFLHVLEHFTMEEAIQIIERFKQNCETMIVGLPNSRKDHIYTGTGPHSHKWGIHDFPFEKVGLTRTNAKSNIYKWKYKENK